MEVIEQERIRRRFSQAVNTYDDHAEAQKRICAHLVQLLTVYTCLLYTSDAADE